MTRTPHRRLLAIALASGLASLHATHALAQSPTMASPSVFTVSDIRVDGLQRIGAGTVFTYLPIERGDTIDSTRIGEAMRALHHGLELDGRQLKPARVTQMEPQRLRFVLKEGRNRQIRRMCELVGLEVSDLLRIRIGPLNLGDLPEGRWRHLTPDERDQLIKSS